MPIAERRIPSALLPCAYLFGENCTARGILPAAFARGALRVRGGARRSGGYTQN
jgi:hypothetical protein